MDYSLKSIKVGGFTTDFNKCDCCGKQDLQGTITITDLDSGTILHFGTTCAAKADKYDNLEALRLAKKEIGKAVRSDRKNKTDAEARACDYLRRHFKMDNARSVIDQCSICCYEDVYLQLLNHYRSGSNNALRVDIPDQWTGINRQIK